MTHDEWLDMLSDETGREDERDAYAHDDACPCRVCTRDVARPGLAKAQGTRANAEVA